MNSNKVSRPFTSTEAVAELLIILLAMSASFDLVGILVDFYQVMVLSKTFSDEIGLSTIDEIQRILGAIQLVFHVFAGVFFLIWFYRAHRNLPALDVRWRRYSSPWSILLFFVPIANLYYGYDLVKELWKQSSPELGFSDDFFTRHASTLKQYRSKTVLIGVWWGFALASNRLGGVAFKAYLRTTTVSEYISNTWTSMISDALGIVASILLIAIVNNINERQEEKYRRLILKAAEAERNVPAPALT